MTAKFGNDPILLRADMKHKDIFCQSRSGKMIFKKYLKNWSQYVV